jgi:hypothetical protein
VWISFILTYIHLEYPIIYICLFDGFIGNARSICSCLYIHAFLLIFVDEGCRRGERERRGEASRPGKSGATWGLAKLL